jgi:2-iminobutanoate/2-iminopropanoate deaminase
MSKQAVQTELAPAAIGPYSQAIRSGNLVFCSGQIALIPESGAMVEGDVEDQTRQVLSNLGNVLQAAGAGWNDVVKTTIFLKDLGDFQRVNAIYAKQFGDNAPARATVEVSRLPKDALVEIDAIASLGSEPEKQP